MTYKDGKTEPKKGDTVLGDKLKGRVVVVGPAKVTVETRAPYNPKDPAARKTEQVEKDPADLELVYRK